jgi:hypothetical protein
MIKCPFCHATFVANTVFCSECGNYLLEDDKRATDPLFDADQIDKVNGMAGGPKIASSSPPNARPVAVQLKIGEGKREVEVGLDKDIHIGRVDPASNVFPEIDLTDEGNSGKSVSRRHARIFKREKSVVLEDLGSFNGTYINGKKLDPYLPEDINDGDILHLGRISMEVRIQRR